MTPTTPSAPDEVVLDERGLHEALEAHLRLFPHMLKNDGIHAIHDIISTYLRNARGLFRWGDDDEVLPVSASPQPAGVTEEPGSLAELRAANIKRQAIWCPDEVPDLSFRGNELGGETGEALNVIKKLERERQGWRGSRDTKEHLAEELADVVICADLCALSAGVDLAAAVVAKFNATSDKVGIPVHMEAARLPSPTDTRELSDDEERLVKLMEGTATAWEAATGPMVLQKPSSSARTLRKALALINRFKTEAPVEDGWVRVPQSALDWLFGSGPDANGKWFGEVEEGFLTIKSLNDRRPPFWWRSHFRRLIPALAASTKEE